MAPLRFTLSALLACGKTLLELVNASAGINKLLLAGIKRMALGADFNIDIAKHGVRFYRSTASATDNRRLIVGMNSSFHV